MKRPQNVPAEAVYNSLENQWELGTKNSKGEKTGEWKYWWGTTGHFCCHSFLDETTNTLTHTRFHPDGTYSLKGTLINNVLDGTICYQKSEHETTESALADPLYENVFRVVSEFKNGQAIWWKYFNKEGQIIDLDGDVVLSMEEFACNFQGYEVPDELSLLLTFQQMYGAELYAQGFSLTSGDESAIATWSKDKDFLKRLMPFASANGSGSVYGVWDDGKGKSINQMPVVVFGDEGGVHIVAKNILQLMQLLIYDAEISVGDDKAYFYKDEDEPDESPHAQSYRHWMKETFNLDDINDPDEIVKSAQDEFKASFDAWFNQYYS